MKRRELLEAQNTKENPIDVDDIIESDILFLTKEMQSIVHAAKTAELELKRRMKGVTPIDKAVVTGFIGTITSQNEQLELYKQLDSEYFDGAVTKSIISKSVDAD